MIAAATLATLPWQTSLSTCWTNASCNRALIVGHGGDPNFVTRPLFTLRLLYRMS